MRILITSQVFPPEVHPTAVMVKELALDFVARGWEVTVVAGFPHHPYGRLYLPYRKSLRKIEYINGLRIVRSWHLINPSNAILARALVMVSQCIAFCLSSITCPRPEIIISIGPPLLGPLFSALIASLSRAKLVTVVYDIYPDIAVELGYLRNRTLLQAAHRLERLIYEASDQIVILSEGFRRTLIKDKGVQPEKLEVIPVWLDGRKLSPMERDNSWRREMGIDTKKFVVLYAGTIGLVSGAGLILEAARQLLSYTNIFFLIVGDGHLKEKLATEAQRLGLTNMQFLPFQPRERLREMQATADISLVTLAPGRGRTSVPSKVLGYMAAARPVIAAVDAHCDTAELVNISKCGRVVPPSDGISLAKTILEFYLSPEACQTAGICGFKYFSNNFEAHVVLRKYNNLILRLFS